MRTIFLLDIDCFFASVEMALNPTLRGKPLCIGGHKGDRGIVACPNYEARAYGVKTAMPLRTAAKLLPPDAVFMPGHHKLYGEYSERVMNILNDFTPDVEQVSIDEAYMDVTGCLHFWDYPDSVGTNAAARMANAMMERIWTVCGLSVSIGVASNKVCAKIAAGLKKPHGLVVVPHGQEKEFLAPLPIEMVPGVGKMTTPKLHAQGIFTVADVLHQTSVPGPLRFDEHNGARSRPDRVGTDNPRSWLGRYLTAVANGEHESVMHYDRVEHSISRDTTFWHDTNDAGFIQSTLFYLTERCCKTLRERKQVASTVTLKVRFSNFTTVQKQTTLHTPTANEEEVFGAAWHLLPMVLPPRRMVRLVGVKVSHLLPVEATQLELAVVKSEKMDCLHRRLDALQEKHGYKSIQWGITHALGKRYESNDDGYRLHHPVYSL